MNWRKDPFLKILHIIGGTGTLDVEEGGLAFQANGVCIIPPGIRHRLVDNPGRAVSLCGIALRGPEFRPQKLPVSAFGRAGVMASTPQGLPALFQELLAEERLHGTGWERMQVSIAWRILVLLARAEQPGIEPGLPDSRQRVARSAAQMERDFWRDQTLEATAHGAGLSRRRFTQLFRALTGESWHGRLERLRIAHAVRLLTTTPIAVRAVAFECGHTDLAHFYRTFRKCTGQTPGAVRERGRRPSHEGPCGEI